ncbi:ATP-grasp domain-containing protein [Citricoccus sp. NR2]|uniref:ATP-grasp domain-containing protein n=1 Tax=Citricoccus sp. NR2 TaxID=3004095 RepID=UPI0022DDA457|nr:ATP-grasp domain-containing protein [Citricoccus sp. NR2]WBL17765.1 ATP-grasp domain-containing protein [Citricoccus sp. NR2]
MKITFLLTRRVPDVPSPILLRVAERLRAAGHQVTGWIPEDRLLRADVVVPEADLYILKSHTEHALSYAAALHDTGAPLLNSYPACLIAQDKVTAARRMRQHGIPTPETWLVTNPQDAAELLAEGPLIIKPHRGHRGAGVRLVHRAEELQQLGTSPAPAEPLIAQRHVPGPGEDLKVYVAGENVWSVRKPFDEESFARPGVSVPLPEGVYEIAQRTRRAFGLELFGIDIIESEDGPFVVDVNYFPGYKGCPAPEQGITEVILNQLATLAVHH